MVSWLFPLKGIGFQSLKRVEACTYVLRISFLSLLLLSGCVSSSQIFNESYAEVPFTLTYEEAQRLLTTEDLISNVCRSSGYDRLMFSAGKVYVDIGPSGFRTEPLPAASTVLGNDSGQIGIWYTDLRKDGVHFADGHGFTLGIGERFGASPGWLYYYVYTASGIRIHDGTDHSVLVSLSLDVYPYMLVSVNESLYLFTIKRDDSGKPNYLYLRYIKNEESFILADIGFTPGCVFDVSKDERWFLINNGWDMFAQHYLYSIDTGEKHYLFPCEFWGGFLDRALADRVRSGAIE